MQFTIIHRIFAESEIISMSVICTFRSLFNYGRTQGKFFEGIGEIKAAMPIGTVIFQMSGKM
jgi:alpha/beta superfamily hydrolase